MRGSTARQMTMLALIDPDQLIPADHPIRDVKSIVEEALKELEPVFAGMYSEVGRRSIPPEHLLMACLLLAFYSIRFYRLDPVSLAAKKAAAFRRISRSSRSTRFSRRSCRSSSFSLLVSPSRLPSSTSAWRTQLRSVWSDTPMSLAISARGFWPDRISRTASARKAGG